MLRRAWNFSQEFSISENLINFFVYRKKSNYLRHWRKIRRRAAIFLWSILTGIYESLKKRNSSSMKLRCDPFPPWITFFPKSLHDIYMKLHINTSLLNTLKNFINTVKKDTSLQQQKRKNIQNNQNYLECKRSLDVASLHM